MTEGFESLSEDQFRICKNAIAWITVLIAGSDGKIDRQETSWAKKITEIRSYASPNHLEDFYKDVGVDFSKVLDNLLDRVPSDATERNALLSRKISQLNEIFPLLDNKLAYHLYDSYRTFAHHVAKSSGGFLGFFTVSAEEKKLMSLPMLNEVIYDEEA